MSGLALAPVLGRPDLVAEPVAAALQAAPGLAARVEVAEIDPVLADTEAFCTAYDVPGAETANCVVLFGRRAGEVRPAACVVLATTRADVNGVVRRHLDLRKVSFAPMDDAVDATGMEYGGITPIGLPPGWPVLVDPAVAALPAVVLGSGLRRSKLRLPGEVLMALAGAVQLPGLGRPVEPLS